MAIEQPDPHETHTGSEEEDEFEDLAFCPFVGKEFMTEEDAKHFYNGYAYRMGFSIRRSTFYKSVKSDEVTSLRFVCSMAGIPKKCKEAQNENAPTKSPQKDRPANRTGCKASLRIRLVDGIWKVTVFNDVHNHPLVTSPSKKRSLRSHKSMDSDDREYINSLNAQNIEAAKIHECLAVKHGGRQFLRFKRKDISNEIAYQKQKFVGVDVDSTLVYFQKKQEDDPEFFYAVDVDESGRLKNLFWVDGRARRAFQEFGDVVTFDTTYQTNRYKMPLAPFIGVNHHRMNIYFGIAMLRSEGTSAFVWLFEKWVEAMYGKKPFGIAMLRSEGTSTQEQEALRFATLKPRMMKILKMASKSCDAFKHLKGLLDIAEEQLGPMVCEEENLSCDIGTTTRKDSHVLDPPVSQCKGKRKQPKRLKPPSEPKRFKPRKCSICGNTKGGHNSRTCPLKKVAGKKKNKKKDDDVESMHEDDDYLEDTQEEEDLEDAGEEDEFEDDED